MSASHIDQVFELGIAADSLADMLDTDPRDQLEVVCSYCGFFNGTMDGNERPAKGQPMSPAWRKALGKEE